jgi:hypothetical protein
MAKVEKPAPSNRVEHRQKHKHEGDLVEANGLVVHMLGEVAIVVDQDGAACKHTQSLIFALGSSRLPSMK